MKKIPKYEHRYSLTDKQTNKLIEVIETFAKRCVERYTILPGEILLLINSVRGSIIENSCIDQYEADVVIWILDILFEQMGEKEFDPLLEQVYNKITGYWPTEIQWFDRDLKTVPKT